MPLKLRLFYSALVGGQLLIPAVALYSELIKRSQCDMRVAYVLIYAAALGAGAIVLLIVATGRLAYRGEKDPVVR